MNEEIIVEKPTEKICTIEVNYSWVCDQLLRRCKRTPDDLITSEALIDACMELSRGKK